MVKLKKSLPKKRFLPSSLWQAAKTFASLLRKKHTLDKKSINANDK
jgi:hypothetical protein